MGDPKDSTMEKEKREKEEQESNQQEEEGEEEGDGKEEGEKEGEEEGEICPICRDELSNPVMIKATLECNHAFHLHCLGAAFNRTDGVMRCPYCFKTQYPGRWALFGQDISNIAESGFVPTNNNDQHVDNNNSRNNNLNTCTNPDKTEPTPTNTGEHNNKLTTTPVGLNTCCEICNNSNHTTSMITTLCGHKFHLHCIGSHFNKQQAMKCYTCGAVDNNTTSWLYCEGYKQDENEVGLDDDFDAMPHRMPIDLKATHVMLVVTAAFIAFAYESSHLFYETTRYPPWLTLLFLVNPIYILFAPVLMSSEWYIANYGKNKYLMRSVLAAVIAIGWGVSYQLGAEEALQRAQGSHVLANITDIGPLSRFTYFEVTYFDPITDDKVVVWDKYQFTALNRKFSLGTMNKFIKILPAYQVNITINKAPFHYCTEIRNPLDIVNMTSYFSLYGYHSDDVINHNSTNSTLKTDGKLPKGFDRENYFRSCGRVRWWMDNGLERVDQLENVTLVFMIFQSFLLGLLFFMDSTTDLHWHLIVLVMQFGRAFGI